MAAFDFPASPINGQVFTPPGGPTYVYQSPVWMRQTGANPGPTMLTFPSSAAWVKPSNAKRAKFRGGGGGGGGGAGYVGSGGSASGSGGAGGACGETPWIDISNPAITGGTVTLGAAGTAGSSSTFGGDGGDTTIVITGLGTLTFQGGEGGTSVASATTLALVVTPNTASVTTTDSVNLPVRGGSDHAGPGTRGMNGHGGTGGSSPWGTGGWGSTPPSLGTNGQGRCSGGGGGSADSTSSRAGGVGTQGYAEIEFDYGD